MSTSFLSLTLPGKHALHGTWAPLIAALSVLMPPTAAQAELVWKAISVNFTNSSNLLSPTEFAGNATEGSFANWNNMQSGTSLNGLSWDSYPDNWTAPQVDLSIWTGTNGTSSPNFATTTGQPNGYTSGIVINTALSAPTSGNSSDNKLYAAGANARTTDGPSGVYQTNTFSLSGLNAAFPNGYKIYVYQSAGAASNNTGAWGSITASGSTGGTADFGSNPFVASTNASYTYGTAGSTSAAYGFQNNTAFNGTYAVNKFMTITQTSGAMITSDVFALSNYVYSLTTGSLSNQLVNGIQVVGQVEVIPEPASIALGLCGVGGFAAFGFLRRARGRRQQAAERDQDPPGTA